MHLSKKVKTFSQFLAAFLKYASNFEHLEKKKNVKTYISEIIGCEKTGLLKCLESPISEHS